MRWLHTRVGRRARLARAGAPSVCALWLITGCARFGYELLDISADGPPEAGTGGTNTAGAPEWDSGLSGPAVGGTGGGGQGNGNDIGRDAGGLGGAGGSSRPPDGGPCDALGPFAEPELVTGLGGGPFFSPALAEDGLFLMFASAAPGDLFSARRSSRSSVAFSGVTPSSLNTPSAEVTPSLSADGLTLLFASDRTGALSPRDLMLATRPTLDAAFGTPSFLTELNTFWTENLPSLHANGTLLTFTSDRPGGSGIMDLWQASRPSGSGPFGNATPLSELDTSADDSGASLTDDLRRVYFTSERPGGAGGRDLWFAERASANALFSAPQNLTEINGPTDEADAAISRDGSELFFASDRAGTSQIWRSVRTCLPPRAGTGTPQP